MSKFNDSRTKCVNKSHDSVNIGGGKSKTRNFENEMAMIVLNSMLAGDTYYETDENKLNRIKKYIRENLSNEENAKFVAKAMIYGRKEGYLRSISHLLAFLLSENVKKQPFVRKSIEKMIIRPDDMTEIVALWDKEHPNKMIPNSIRRAFKSVLENALFDEYQFKKYSQSKSKIKLKDIVKLTHPNPKKYADQNIFKKIIEDKLPSIETAQTINTNLTEQERQKKYIEMIRNRKLGYMAMIKNLNKIFNYELNDEEKQIIFSALQDVNLIKKSKILPFRIVQAFLMIEKLNIDEFIKKEVKQILENVIDIIVQDADFFVDENEKVAILLDDSGSMTWGNNNKPPFFIGKVMLGMILKKIKNKDNVITYFWSDDCRKMNLENKDVLDIVADYNANGGGTLVSAPLKELLKTKTKVDKIFILTDMQMYDEDSWWGTGGNSIGEVIDKYIEKYKKEINQNVEVIFWNLNSYEGGTPFDNSKKIIEMNGYSDKMIEILPHIIKDKDYLVNKIKEIEI
jgi:60 kDa SS-A/Ro ribonucleoprotein